MTTRLTAVGDDGQVKQPIWQAVEALARGGMCIVVDDEHRENEGDLVVAADAVTAEQVAFMVRNTTGILCAPMTDGDLQRLALPPMVSSNTEVHRTAFAVSVDACGVSTGVSAQDRTRTFRALAHGESTPDSFTRPGHVFPLRYRPGGVLKRAGHTEASIDLVRMAGRRSIAVIGELVSESGEMMRGPEIAEFARRHELPVVTIEEIIRHRRSQESLVVRAGESRIATRRGEVNAVAYTTPWGGVEHLAVVIGDVAAESASGAGVLVRVHSECLTGDVFASLRCDCGTQLEDALELIHGEGVGVVVYLRGHEGRGIGLGHKLRAYVLQDQGRDTVEANVELGFPVDDREYGVGAQILADLGVRRLRLLTNNPAKYTGLAGYDLEIVERIGIPSRINPHNRAYLATKRDRLGHDLEVPDRPSGQVSAW